MKKTAATFSATLAIAFLVGCSGTAPSQNSGANRTSWDLPLDPVAAQSQAVPGKEVQALATPLVLKDVEDKTGAYLEKRHGMKGEKVRSFACKHDDIVTRSEAFKSMETRHQDLLVVEHKGNFTSGSSAPQAETFPYAMLVVDARSGELVTEFFYAERYRPK